MASISMLLNRKKGSGVFYFPTTTFTLSEAATASFDALRLLRMSRRGGVEGPLRVWRLYIYSKNPTTERRSNLQMDRLRIILDPINRTDE